MSYCTIGRRDVGTAEILIDDSTVSSRHAVIYRNANGNTCIRDEGSRNGTLIRRGQQYLPVKGEEEIFPGDQVYFGKAMLSYDYLINGLKDWQSGRKIAPYTPPAPEEKNMIRCFNCAKPVSNKQKRCPHCDEDLTL